ncbi:MAG: hypothetical protein IAG13_22170 [Deltaproteobacteria bacterium]|nr:hypothetical protein [Nannocystaceae bacterium]
MTKAPLPRGQLRSLLVTAAVMLVLPCCANEELGGDGEENTSSLSGIFVTQGGQDAESSSSTAAAETSTTDDTVGSLNCEKIDFVFVIDNSSSMADEQQNLVAAVPGFVDSMRTALPTVKSFRVGVVDTDRYPGLGTIEDPLEGCPEGNDCSGCDYQLGAFLGKPLAAADPSTSCSFSTGDPFMEGASEAFPEEFACAAVVGTGGNPVEQQVGALIAAVDPSNTAEGGCNAGFMRDDALLVFLMITDEEDDHTDAPAPQGGSAGEPAEWFDALVAAKSDKVSNVVALGLIGGSPRFPDCTALSADGKGAEQSTRLEQFFDSFDAHFEGSVCSQDYATFFDDALAKVSQGCMNFIP